WGNCKRPLEILLRTLNVPVRRTQCRALSERYPIIWVQLQCTSRIFPEVPQGGIDIVREA
ncbi:hypothetical protein, partial [Mesorhizobium sp. M1C.F.Ca.ET.188.01.1.1]|uniref:hypothetical protein n=1 Tax=Mesorhizobium sp. M1C.F.Ca.ET.188.01.1.1 TaxID=2563924 RepID=UPI001AEF13F5